MKRRLTQWVLPFTVLLSIPLVYNACQNQIAGFGAIGASSTSCKVSGLQNGLVTELKTASVLPDSPFSAKKVSLRGAGAALHMKATTPIVVSSGTKLGVIADNECLQNQTAASPISKQILQAGGTLPGLSRQAYGWVSDRDYSESEIEAIADQDPCIVGMSWNQKFQIQSMALNDPSYFVQDDLFAIHAGDAYDLFYAAKGGMSQTGSPVVVATVDTGVDYTHPDLQNSMWSGPMGLGIDVPTMGTSSVSYDPMDISTIGHGTHVSGMIAATSNNGVGIVGAMPFRAKIMGVKIFQADSQGNLSTTSQDLYNGIQFAYTNGANVINMSVGSITSGATTDALAQQGVTEAVQHGTTVIVVIGNAENGSNGALIDGVATSSIPGQYATIDGVIGVGSFDVSTGQKSYFSEYSTTYAEIGAPGAEQGSTGLFSTVPVKLSSYARLAGTSQAAPLVSAAAALTIGLIRESYGIIPTPKEVERLIEDSAIKSPDLAPYFKNGNRLDYLNLVQKINMDYPLTASGQHVSACP